MRKTVRENALAPEDLFVQDMLTGKLIQTFFILRATLLYVSTRNFLKWNLKKYFFHFNGVIYSDVGVSGIKLKVTPWGSYKSSNFKGLKSVPNIEKSPNPGPPGTKQPLYHLSYHPLTGNTK